MTLEQYKQEIIRILVEEYKETESQALELMKGYEQQISTTHKSNQNKVDLGLVAGIVFSL